MNRRSWYYKNGTCFEEFDILFDNGRFMLVQNVETKVFSFGVCENFGTLYGFPVNWSCLTKDQAIERLNNMIRIDKQYSELEEVYKQQFGYTNVEQWQAMIEAVSRVAD